MQTFLRKKRKGFTLIELIVVIAVIGILVLLAMPKFMDYTAKAKMTQIKNDVKVAETTIDEYLSSNATLPDGFDTPDMTTPLSEGRIFDVRGRVASISGDEADYRDVTTMDEVMSIKSKLPGQFVANGNGKVYYIHTKAINIGDSGLGNDTTVDQPYSEEQITDMVENQGWIPVASADELQQINDTSATLKTWGAGTSYRIEHAGGLGEKYVQVADIDLLSYGSGYDGGQGWMPIGSSSVKFNGSYDGGNYVISNLYLNRPSQNYVGLFGYINESGSIENIKLINPVGKTAGGLFGFIGGEFYSSGYARNISIINGQINDVTEGEWGIGLGFGYIDDGEVRDIDITGEIIINNIDTGEIGGFAGGIWDAKIENITISADITDNTNTGWGFGGVFGQGWRNEIKNTFYEGNITAGSAIGGIAGYVSDTIAEINHVDANIIGSNDLGGNFGIVGEETILINNYSSGAITGANNTGGLIGRLDEQWGHDNVEIINNHSVSEINSSGLTPGGLIGGSAEPKVLLNSYYYQNPNNGLGAQVTEAAMADVGTFHEWNFDDIWGINEKPYPTFKVGYEKTLEPGYSDINTQICSGEHKTARIGYTPISNANELNDIRNNLGGKYILVSDIDLSGYSAGEGWEPIGTSGNPFTGVLDGNCYTISNLTINKPTATNVGLFGVIDGYGSSMFTIPKIYNLQVENVNISGEEYVGALAGKIRYSMLNDIHTSGTVTTYNLDAGGVVGGAFYSGITNTSSSADVIGTTGFGDSIGGIAGTANDYSYLYRLSSSGSVTGLWKVGGIIGESKWDTVMYESSSTATVFGEEGTGGLIGEAGENILVDQSYFSGEITATDTDTGGIIGRTFSDVKIERSYSDGSIIGTLNVGGIIGEAVSNDGSTLNAPIIRNSSFYGTISGGSNIGGIIGNLAANWGGQTTTNPVEFAWKTYTGGNSIGVVRTVEDILEYMEMHMQKTPYPVNEASIIKYLLTSE